jgi:hypothetical protein
MAAAPAGGTVTVRLPAPSACLGLAEVQVTPGVVDREARELFLYSQCQVLALCLHERTGWPLWAAEQQLPSGSWSWAHVGVRTPRGRWLDIDGPRDAREVTRWLEDWGPPARVRIIGGAAKWMTLLGAAPVPGPGAWWRTLVGGAEGAALAEEFARVLLAAEDFARADPGVDAARAADILARRFPGLRHPPDTGCIGELARLGILRVTGRRAGADLYSGRALVEDVGRSEVVSAAAGVNLTSRHA